ncbi:hypothetical protein [Priestia megaterium]|uniref:hypothetical protein n=1 Tax=Priestia megaterium TaxID=1404 RepID=UPI000BFDD741|nr:hypothetical protein [Priestia megaterium]PGX73772.1 hypothetical protein COE31_21265 [Priestia megaterium]
MSDFDFENFSIEPEDDEVERDIDLDISNYGLSVRNLQVSPYESLNMLDLRDILDDNIEKMSDIQKKRLWRHDFKLLFYSKLMAARLAEVYNFEYSRDIPEEKWWWHLNNRELIKKIYSSFRQNKTRKTVTSSKVNYYINQ